ncbi:MAG: autotransporter outer membrane beta-barrel domain-containing protein, partial [Mailhella sp.]|nr:autotransporter outer membrane beta-barrel domain-containing protein [Mailhella sp.]
NGSRIHVTGASAMFGMAWTAGMEQAKLLGGAFLEFGAARMTARMKIGDFYDRNRFRGKGDASCAGGGLMLRADLTGTKLSGLYAEASFRAGSMDSVWRSDDLSAVWNGRRVRYDISTPYYGAHAGLGYVLRLSETWSIDFSGKYLWTHLDGRSTHVAGDPYLFKAMDSQRLRFGVRAEAKLSGRSVAYAGAAWEREFDGDAGATAFGFDTPSTSIRGDTGTLGLGVSFSPSSLPDLRLEIGGSAFTGKRRGVSGTFLLTYAF